MQLAPRLIEVLVPERPGGVVLVLHGGASRRANVMVSPAQLSVLRMVPIARRIARVGAKRLAVFRLLNSARGWDTAHPPVLDVTWALDRVADRLGGRIPTCLVGHSLGGRAAILSAGQPEVHSVVALAPWVQATDVPAGLSGKRILIVHGSKDRIASPALSARLAERLGREAEVAYITIEGGTHAMLSFHELYDGLAAQFASVTLLGTPPSGPLARVAAGERWIRI